MPTFPSDKGILPPREALKGPQREKRLVLLVTYACQFDCRYCCVRRSLLGRRDMSLPHLLKAGDFLLSSSYPNLQLHFFGAEPLLLPFEKYRQFLPYIRKRAAEEGKNLRMMVTSNAAVVRSHWVDLFEKYGVALEISLDGAPESHNKNRPTVSGRDSYAGIAENLPRLFAAGIPMQVSMVISPQTAAHVVENFNHILDIGFRKLFMMVANCVTWPAESLRQLREGLKPLLDIYPRVMWQKGVRLLNLTDWVWPMRMNTELAVDSSGDIYSACVGYLARDPHLKGRCSLAHIDSVMGSYDYYEKLRLKNAQAMGIVFGESSALHTLASSAIAGQIMTEFVGKLRERVLAECKNASWRKESFSESRPLPLLHSLENRTRVTEPPAHDHKELHREALEQIRIFVAGKPSADQVIDFLNRFVGRAKYSARVFEVALHSLFQALEDRGALEGNLKPLARVRGEKKRQGNMGDVEVVQSSGTGILEAWDARYGRTYLRDELEEISDKLKNHPQIRSVGFVVDLDSLQRTSLKTEVLIRKKQIEDDYKVSISMLSFQDWAGKQLCRAGSGPDTLAGGWLIAFAESLCLLRPQRAPLEDAEASWPSELRDFAGSWMKPKAE
ncbi:MAG: radical SAM protein [Elusimicrobia bacterium]|nr:radical SAM protein [Elusimicrobiota bacterium]